ncbi:ABC transporter ATP-binding protein [Candidatus Woesearchaeota archaeon]|nr:ABC transporter ATP-binding protein [Candidatus Woesearchaeota archaeon]
MAKNSVIRLDNVWKTYKMGEVDVQALRGLSLEVNDGEFVAIEGPSGSGKSTAMNMIGALDYPSKGSVYLGNHDITKLSESQLAVIRGRKIGFVFQQFNLLANLSAMENVALPMMFQGVSPSKRRERARNLLESVGLGDRLNHRPSELSGGQQQRVAIARALSNNPEVILADEPTGNIDSKTGQAIIALLRGMHREGKTIIMITHDHKLAKFADRIELLKDGVIVGGSKK